jgi:hypothetical protein
VHSALDTPTSTVVFDAQALLFMFLPRRTAVWDLPAASDTVRHWFTVWASVDPCASWDAVWMTILRRIMRHSAASSTAVGYPWGQHLPFILSRIQLLANLKIGGQKVPLATAVLHPGLSVVRIAPSTSVASTKLVVDLLGHSFPRDDGVTTGLALVKSYLSTLDSYLHPHNADADTLGLATFLSDYTVALAKRVGRENGLSMAGVEPCGEGCVIPLNISVF